MENETWKPVVGYKSHYIVSNFGKIKSIKFGKDRLIKSNIGANGYSKCSLCYLGKIKTVSIHVIVLEAFKGDRPMGFTGSHLDGNRQNNNADNLIWESSKDNHARRVEHGTHSIGENNANSKLNKADVLNIREKYKTGNYSQRQLGKIFNVTQTCIRHIVTFKTWNND